MKKHNFFLLPFSSSLSIYHFGSLNVFLIEKFYRNPRGPNFQEFQRLKCSEECYESGCPRILRIAMLHVLLN